ncbi:hypothetical protein [Ruegeria sp.]|uniref:hypothetical protein n=1 Tax=Ruegeria sp. TaxID=1879320 RepID=UPI003AFFC685
MVRRDSADEIIRYAVEVSGGGFTPPSSSYWYEHSRNSEGSESAVGTRYNSATFNVRLEVRLDNVVIRTLSISVTTGAAGRAVLSGVLPARLTPVGRQKRLTLRATGTVRTGGASVAGIRGGSTRVAWSAAAYLTLTARETRPFA